jgi:hypothetical protein
VGEERTGATGTDRRRLTVPQAAKALGVTVDAVRGRIRRGKLDAEHDKGAVYVWIDAPEAADSRGPSETSQGPAPDQAERIEDLRGQVTYLREQLEEANERDRENRRIIAALTSRIPAIEAPQEASEDAETLEEAPDRAEEPRSATGGAQEGARRPWWRRVFRG